MIDFDLYTRIHLLHHQDKLTGQQIAQKLSLNPKTVAKWLARERFEARKSKGRSSKLDPHKALIRAWLEKHPYSAQQIFRRLIGDCIFEEHPKEGCPSNSLLNPLRK